MPIADFERQQPFRTVVESIYIEEFKSIPSGPVVTIGLKKQDGKRISIGGLKTNAEVEGFARTLEKGKEYEFPKAWLDYRQGKKRP